MSRYCFTLDDNIRFLQEATNERLGSILSHPYIRLLQRVHDTYGTKFQLNMFYSYFPGDFSLNDVPSCWRDEFEHNADWLKLSFHSRHNVPKYPYLNGAVSELIDDYKTVTKELFRIAGKAARARSTTIHYVCASKEACIELRRQGIEALIGMFYPLDGPKALKYYLSPDEADTVRKERIWRDNETGITFACNSIVLNAVETGDIIPALEKEKGSFYELMIHEQYFYKDYINYQSDFEKKVMTAIEYMSDKGCQSVFLEELL